MSMNHDVQSVDSSQEEEQELIFSFEQQQEIDEFSPRLHSQGSDVFYSIDGVDFERPANPMVAVLEYLESADKKKRARAKQAPPLQKLAVTPLSSKRKRKTLDLPNTPAQVIRPVAKRSKSMAYERCVTALASMMGNVMRDHHEEHTEEAIHQVEHEVDDGPFRSASINIPSSFQPILWPGDAAVSESHSYSSSSSSSKSRASGLELVCRRSLDVLSPVHVRFKDLALHSSAGSYTGL